MERRKYLRKSLHQQVVLTIKSEDVPCTVKNISEGGALLSIKPSLAGFITNDDIGLEISLSVVLEETPLTIEGRVIRYHKHNNEVVLAIFFLRR